MRTIQLTKGQVALVDDDDFERLNQFKWYACYARNTRSFYAQRGFPNRFYMSRVIMNTPEHLEVDHIDGNTLNNQKSNLRNVTSRQNSQNRHMIKTSKYPGVNWDKTYGKWLARIRVNGVTRYIVRCDKEEDAATAYRVAEVVLCAPQT